MSTRPKLPVLFVPACIHLSKQTELPAQSLLNPLVMVEVRGCAQYGRCTVVEPAEDVKGCCNGCGRYQPVRGQGGWRRLIAVF